MAAAISLAEVPKPSGIETQAVQAIEARPKLQAAIEEQKHKLEEADFELAKTFASQTQTLTKVDVEKALQSNKASKELEEQTKHRIEALQRLQEKLNKHLDQLKADYPEAVSAALTLRMETLEKARLGNETEGKGLVEEIKSLKAEINKLPKGAAKKAGSSY